MSAAIEVVNLRREFRVRAGLLAPVKRVIAVDDVTFSVPAGGVLGIVARVADRVSVMYAGEVVERAPTADLFRFPQHPYTRGLLSCVPVPGRVQRDRPLGSIPGTVPTIAPGFAGCAFRSRCAHADETCAHEIPRRQTGAAHDYLCRLAPAEVAEAQPA